MVTNINERSIKLSEICGRSSMSQGKYLTEKLNRSLIVFGLSFTFSELGGRTEFITHC